MIRKNTTLGPGPERLTNAWLNKVQDEVESTIPILGTFSSGVLWGCAPRHDDTANTVRISYGSVICDGTVCNVFTDEKFTLVDTGKAYWMYVGVGEGATEADEEVKLRCREMDAGDCDWPDRLLEKADLGAPEYYSPVLAVAYHDGSQWTVLDARKFVVSKPNNASLIVGDLDAGADFETVQQALDYLALSADAEDESGKPRNVPQHILLTAPQFIEEPLRIGCDGVTIEGLGSNTTVYWNCEPSTNAGASVAESIGALFDIGGAQGVSIKNIHAVHVGSLSGCCFYNPGARFLLDRCWCVSILSDGFYYCIVFESEVNENVTISNNVTNPLVGLTSYTAALNEEDDLYLWGCLSNSVIEKNYIFNNVIEDTISFFQHHPLLVQFADDILYSIDLGVHAHQCVNNVVRDNLIQGSINGIRVGQLSEVSGNAIVDCLFFGVIATAAGQMTLPIDPADIGPWKNGGNSAHYATNNKTYFGWNNLTGTTHISGNYIEMYADASVKFPFNRTGIRLEMPSCHVNGNTVVISQNAGLGIIQGPLLFNDKNQALFHMISLYDGNHTVSENNIVMNPVKDGEIIPGVITRPGVGIGLLSSRNTIANNGVFHARAGIIVGTYSVVANNVITPSVTPVFAWCYNSVSGNTIGWYPHVRVGLPWTEYQKIKIEFPMAAGGIMISVGNVVDGNHIACGSDPGKGYERPAAIHAYDWAAWLGGLEWVAANIIAAFFESEFEDDAARMIIGEWVGNNTISNCMIELTRIPLASEFGNWRNRPIESFVNLFNATYYNVDGIILNGVRLNLEPPDPSENVSKLAQILAPMLPVKTPPLWAWDANTVSGTLIWRGKRGIVGQTGKVVVSSSSVMLPYENGLLLEMAPGSTVADSVFMTIGYKLVNPGLPVEIRRESQDSMLNDCLICQMGISLGRIFSAANGPDAMDCPVCLDQGANRVTVNDCTIVNFGNAGIHWRGNYGESSGCWFFTRQDLENRPHVLPRLAWDIWNALDQIPNDFLQYVLYIILLIVVVFSRPYGRYLHAIWGRYPAIYFHPSPRRKGGLLLHCVVNEKEDISARLPWCTEAQTEGNLVMGAHMANCQMLEKQVLTTVGSGNVSFEFFGEQRNLSSPILWENTQTTFDHCFTDDSSLRYCADDPFFPPRLDSLRVIFPRWTNRVDWRSCYTLSIDKLFPTPVPLSLPGRAKVYIWPTQVIPQPTDEDDEGGIAGTQFYMPGGKTNALGTIFAAELINTVAYDTSLKPGGDVMGVDATVDHDNLVARLNAAEDFEVTAGYASNPAGLNSTSNALSGDGAAFGATGGNLTLAFGAALAFGGQNH